MLVHLAAQPQLVLLYMFLCVLRAQLRTQNTQKHIQKDELRLRRKVYEHIAATVATALPRSPYSFASL